jgi:hypothetical protein
MAKRWVKFQTFPPTQVSTENCENVDDFIKACKKELPRKLGSYDADQLSLSTSAGAGPLQPDDDLPAQNTAQTPLFISISGESLSTAPDQSESNLLISNANIRYGCGYALI